MKKFTKVFAVLLMIATLALTLTACVPMNADKAADKLEDQGYVVTVQNNIDDDVKAALSATNPSSGGTVSAVWFKDLDDAKDAEKDAKQIFGDNIIVKRSGKCVYYGNEQGIKDFN